GEPGDAFRRRFQDLELGPRRIIFRQLGDLFEKAGARIVVEIFGGQALRYCAKPLKHVRGQSGRETRGAQRRDFMSSKRGHDRARNGNSVLPARSAVAIGEASFGEWRTEGWKKLP